MNFALALVVSLVSVAAEAHPVAAPGPLIGRVVDSAGGSLPGAFVTLRPSRQDSGLVELEAISDNAGRFRFDDVPPGAYLVAGHLAGYQPSGSSVEVAADRDNEVLVVMLIGAFVDCDTPVPYPLRIRTRSGQPLPTAFVTVTRAGRRPWSEVVLPTGIRDQCSALGTEDHVTLDVFGYGEHILKPAGVEPKTVTWQIAIEPSAASRAGRTTRASATGQVRGRVFDENGASIPDAAVSFHPLDPRSGLTPFEAVADSRGRFDFAAVRPGTYRVTGTALGYEITVAIQEVAAGVETDVTVVVRRRGPSASTGPRRTLPEQRLESCLDAC